MPPVYAIMKNSERETCRVPRLDLGRRGAAKTKAMVSVTALNPKSADAPVGEIASGLSGPEREQLRRVFEFAQTVYQGKVLGSGEPALEHALGLARSIASLGLDADSRAAGLLFAIPSYLPESAETLEAEFGVEINADTIAALTSLPTICEYLKENQHA